MCLLHEEIKTKLKEKSSWLRTQKGHKTLQNLDILKNMD